MQYKVAFLCVLIFSPIHASSILLINGQTVSSATLKDKWVLINYWAQWCDTCIKEIPELNRFYKSHHNTNVLLFGINYDDVSSEQQHMMARKYGIMYPLAERQSAITQLLGDVTVLPVTYIFNPKGQLVETLYGGQTVASLGDAINRLQSSQSAFRMTE